MVFELEKDLEVIGEVNDGPSALQYLQGTKPDLIVMDLDLPGMDGIDAANRIHRLDPEMKIIILSISADPISQARAREAGALAYVEKRDGAGRLIQEIRKACEDRNLSNRS